MEHDLDDEAPPAPDRAPTPEEGERPPVAAAAPPPAAPTATFDPKTSRVFISHGKHKAIVGQIKELLEFGSFDPIVSVERESTAIPVPEKVFEDMRSCGAGVIHVASKGSTPTRTASTPRSTTTS